ncbi:hypothetical protein N7489_010169 [Penicillium chrysogenum]|uniref:uncharacterized protein n=1 Tax=Penicillium chrysogenum TaxID=5076 RepID=UPI0024DF19CB|nr:uncharacterized protein N7489_010169 [Penicillium chrysogenum]KAJ5229461.1 hypothetical protein N7489_010169 [Penicillium chrysogenum]
MPKAGHGDRSCSLAIHIRFRSMNGPGGQATYPGKLVAAQEHFYQIADTARASQSVVCLACEVFTWLPQEAGWKSTRAWWDLVTVYRAIVTAALPSSQPDRHSIIISSGKLRKRGNAYDMGGSAFVVDENAEGYSSDDCALYGVKPTAFF